MPLFRTLRRLGLFKPNLLKVRLKGGLKHFLRFKRMIIYTITSKIQSNSQNIIMHNNKLLKV